jgi:hypothetical protein
MIDWLARIARGTTGYGDSWSHVVLAEGALEVALEPRAVLLDLAPLQVIVEEAGGRFASIAGLPSVSGPDGLSSNGTPLHNEVLIIRNLEIALSRPRRRANALPRRLEAQEVRQPAREVTADRLITE